VSTYGSSRAALGETAYWRARLSHDFRATTLREGKRELTQVSAVSKTKEAVFPHVPDKSRYISHIFAVLPKTESLVCAQFVPLFL
jgi:hypothetical protein